MKKIFEFIGAIEVIFYLIATFLFVVIGPFVWGYLLLTDKQYFKVSIVSFFWLISILIIIFDFRRGKKLVVSIGVFLTWLVTLAFVFSERYNWTPW